MREGDSLLRPFLRQSQRDIDIVSLSQGLQQVVSLEPTLEPEIEELFFFAPLELEHLQGASQVQLGLPARGHLHGPIGRQTNREQSRRSHRYPLSVARSP